MRLFEKGTAKEYDFQNIRVVAGRAPNCDLQVDDKTISRKHAVFLRKKESGI